MQRVKLQAEFRDQQGRSASKRLRREGKIPAVLYGHEMNVVNLTFDAKTMDKLLGHEGFHGLINLSITGAPESAVPSGALVTLIKAHQADPISRELTHLDLYKVDMKEAVTVTIPVHVEGTAPGVKAGGILEIVRRELEVSCLPDKIPESIVVDISGLEVGDSIHIENVTIPEGVTVSAETNFTVVAVAAPTKEEEPAPVVVAEGEAAPAEGEEAPTEGEKPEEKPGDKKAKD